MRCTYCGEYAGTRDHVVPSSFTSVKRNYCVGEIVPACQECNALLGSRMLTEVGLRAAYLFEKYKVRYRDVLQKPDWDEEDIEELGPGLRSYVLQGNTLHARTMERLHHLEQAAT